jgi:superoxide dismutase, Fe-Mn family
MPEATTDRRNALVLGTVIALAATAGPGLGQTAALPPKMVYAPQPLPLPYPAGFIPGLSEKLLTSHHDNNYAGAVKRLGLIYSQIAALDPATAPGFLLNGLKREELIATNSMILHELYFANLGPAGSASPGLGAMIERDFGSMARWQVEFAGSAKALAGGSGWVVLQYSQRDKRLVNQWGNDHTMSLVGGVPILVLDMYEHAYATDYGSKAAAYVDAMLPAINWTAANSRFAKAVA